jgi:hypothetical protein
MIRKTGFALALLSLFVLAVPSVALARKASPVEKARVVHHIYDGDDIEGTLVGPDGVWLDAKRTKVLPTLIKYRQSFVPEMVTLELDL